MMFALWTAVTFLAAVVSSVVECTTHDPLRAGDADRLDRNARLVAAGLDLAVRRQAVDELDQLAGAFVAGLEFDAGVEVFGVLRTITMSTPNSLKKLRTPG